MAGGFSDQRRSLDYIKYGMKVGIMTVGSAGFGAVLALFMSSFEFNSTMGVNTDKSTRSQLK